MRRLVAVIAVLLLPALLFLASPSSTASPSRAPADQEREAQAGLRYVALGDSYSSGAGLQPDDTEAPAQCDRSLDNYPSLIAEEIGANLTDVTCSGARTFHYRNSQYEGVPPQLEALSRRTQLVTQTIGGNDRGVFGTAVRECSVRGFQSNGEGSPCKDEFGSQFVDTIRESTYKNLLRALRQVHQAAPRAEVAILGYPSILPPTEGCYPSVPVATGDVPYLRRVQKVLNNVVSRAAVQTDTTFVDLSQVSEGHDACQEPGVRWVEPVIGGPNPPLHPNTLGMQQLAERAIKVLDLGLG